jgi:hypothetical protein
MITNGVLVRVMKQAVRDGIIKVNPARVTGWQKLYKQAEDELLDPRALALPDRETLVALADALVSASHSPRAPPHASARSRAAASETSTPPSGSGPYDARPRPRPEGSRTRAPRTPRASGPARSPSSRRSAPSSPSASSPPTPTLTPACSPGPAADAHLGCEHLRRHDLRHTGLTWFADAGVPVHPYTRTPVHPYTSSAGSPARDP